MLCLLNKDEWRQLSPIYSMLSLYSSLLLTSVLAVGLFFFIRSSVKERPATLRLSVSSAHLPQRIGQHLQYRGYKIVRVDENRETVIFEGKVRFSVALLILLCVLSGIGVACLELVLSIQLAEKWQAHWNLLGIVIAITATGVFYAHGASRMEQVKLVAQPQDQLLIIGHRDELAYLQRSLNLVGELS